MDENNDLPASTPSRVRYEGGLLIAEYHGKVTTGLMLELIDASVNLVNEHHITVVPIVVIFHPDSHMVPPNIAHMAKLLNNQLVRHLSAIVVVGAHRMNQHFVETMAKLFFGNRVRYCDTAEEAMLVAESFKSETTPMLEREH